MNMIAKIKQDLVRWDRAAFCCAYVGGVLGYVSAALILRLLT